MEEKTGQQVLRVFWTNSYREASAYSLQIKKMKEQIWEQEQTLNEEMRSLDENRLIDMKQRYSKYSNDDLLMIYWSSLKANSEQQPMLDALIDQLDKIRINDPLFGK